MTFLLSLLSIYEIILMVRFVTSFFISHYWMSHPAYQILRMVTDPYLALFRFRFLRVGSIDFSPVLAIWFLGLVRAVLLGSITSVGVLLVFVLLSLWDFIRLIGIVLTIVFAFRLLTLSFARQSYPAINYASVDHFLSRLSFGICRLFLRRGFLTYSNSLIWSIVFLLVAGFALNTLVSLTVSLLYRLPF